MPCNATLSQTATTGWTLAFEDEFTQNPADASSQWGAWSSGAYNNELQLYTTAPKNLSVAGGILYIRAVKEATPVTGKTNPSNTASKSFNFTSGRIETKTLFAPNATQGQIRMMARIKLPSGYGMWPAFWSYGDPWPTKGEIDILEARGNEDKVYHTNYFYGRQVNVNLVRNAEAHIYTSASLQSCWHIYELVWTKDALTFYLDGQQVDKKTGGYVADLFGKEEKVTLNLAVGGDYFGNPPASSIANEGIMEIDWVRVYTKN
ncbi:glycoside hydrolase family 16 protein [Nibrella viscosa]|uniref:Glycoside hydrolase family 16 protein n=1 Tax=Nibrella viscosa TaxID=1084524 RepID=A0ABP8JZB9_9BACT